MKIALIVHDLHERVGQGRYLRQLADGLSSGHEVTVFANRCERPVSALWKARHVPSWRINALSTVYTFPIGLSFSKELLKSFPVRHMQGYCGDPGLANIVTAHFCVPAYLNSLSHISWHTRCSLELMGQREKAFYRTFSGPIIAVSRRAEQELREHYHISNPIHVIPHGVDTHRFNTFNREPLRQKVRTEISINEQETLALYVGDLTKVFWHLKKLAEIMPEVQFGIVTSSERYRWKAPNVHFFQFAREIERYYAASDALVFPTRNDLFGMVVLEAMACGLPVFCSDQAGAAELIQSGKDGFVASLNDWIEMTRTALHDRTMLQTVGAAAAQSAQAHDWGQVVRKVEAIYKDVTG